MTTTDEAVRATCAGCGLDVMRYDDGHWFTTGREGYACGEGKTLHSAYSEHVHHGILAYPEPSEDFPSAWAQIGPSVTDHLGVSYYGVRGIDGREYVAESVSPGAWRIVRAGHYGLGAVTHGASLKGAVQHLNAFHLGEKCAQCGNYNSHRGHACETCHRIRYVNTAGQYVPAENR